MQQYAGIFLLHNHSTDTLETLPLSLTRKRPKRSNYTITFSFTRK